MLDDSLLASTLVLAAAGFAYGVFGIGFAMIATPVLALFLDYRTALLLSAVPVLVMALGWLLRHRAAIRQPGAPLTVLPGIVVGALAGVWLQSALPERASLVLLALLLGFVVVLPIAMQRLAAVESMMPSRSAAAFGLLAGVTESALNVGAPFMLLFGGLARLSREQQLLVLNLCFCVGKSIQVPLMATTVPIASSASTLAAGTVVSLAAAVAGDRLGSRLSEATFRIYLQRFLACMVIALLVRAAGV